MFWVDVDRWWSQRVPSILSTPISLPHRANILFLVFFLSVQPQFLPPSSSFWTAQWSQGFTPSAPDSSRRLSSRIGFSTPASSANRYPSVNMTRCHNMDNMPYLLVLVRRIGTELFSIFNSREEVKFCIFISKNEQRVGCQSPPVRRLQMILHGPRLNVSTYFVSIATSFVLQ